MNQQFSALLYSQYSSKCKTLVNLIEQCQIDIKPLINLSFVCIDNEKIRKQICSSKNVNIQSVPCILVVYQDGGVEKYEGSNAFRWIEEILYKYIPPSPPTQTQPQPVPEPQLQTQPLQQPVQSRREVEQQVQQQVQRSQPLQQRAKAPQKPIEETLGGTLIDELESEEEEYNDIKKPVTGIRTNSGNYELGVDFGDMEEPVRDIKRGVKSSTQVVKGGKPDILSAAQAMQKIRDDDMEKSKPIGIAINN
jgi:hypothetical protein